MRNETRPGVLAHHNLAFKPYSSWRVRLVKKGFFYNAVHVDAGFYSKNIRSQHGLVVGNFLACLPEQSCCFRQFVQMRQAGFQTLGVQAQGHFFQRRPGIGAVQGRAANAARPHGGRP